MCCQFLVLLSQVKSHSDQQRPVVLRFWRPKKKASVALAGWLLKGHAGEVSSVAWSARINRLASAAADGAVRIWDVEPLKARWVLTDHADAVNCVAWHLQHGCYYCVSGKVNTVPTGCISLWNPSSRTPSIPRDLRVMSPAIARRVALRLFAALS